MTWPKRVRSLAGVMVARPVTASAEVAVNAASARLSGRVAACGRERASVPTTTSSASPAINLNAEGSK